MNVILANFVLLATLFSYISSSKVYYFAENEENHENLEESKVRKSVAVADRNKLWEEGVIPYEISPECSESLQKTILKAMHMWESGTCLKFIPAEPEHEYRLIILNKRGPCGCCSLVGRVTERQLAIFEESCNKIPIILHELGHAIGFHHEQNRPDRDNYVQILYGNVIKGKEGQFKKLRKNSANVLGFGYDFDSIMHYSSKGFGANGKITIRVLNKSISLNKPTNLSVTDIAVTNKLYRCPNCYFRLDRKTGKISLTSEEELCQWYIERKPGEFIEFYSENIDIPDDESCSTNYLQFQDGYWSKSPIIDRLCGKISSKKYYKTKSSRLLITYKSSVHPNTRFSINYRVICNGTIEADEGQIQSPDFSEPYLYDSSCEWILVVPSNYQVALTFQKFHIRYHENCQSDYLEVLDGGTNANGQTLGRFCGSELPSNIVSNSNTMIVRFVSEKRTVGSGFSATFTKEIDECELPDKGGCTGVCINSLGSYSCECGEGKLWFNRSKSCEKIIDSCGGSYEILERTVIVSPLYPHLYPSKSKCTWKIRNENIRLVFLHMDVDKTNDRCMDKLIVRYDNHKKVLCGYDIPESLNILKASSLNIDFISNRSRERSGFAVLLEPL